MMPRGVRGGGGGVVDEAVDVGGGIDGEGVVEHGGVKVGPLGVLAFSFVGVLVASQRLRR